MAAIAEQEKVRNINMEKQLQALGPPVTNTPVPSPVQDLQQVLQEKDKQVPNKRYKGIIILSL